MVAVALIGGAVMFARESSETENNAPMNNVTLVDGTQIVEIKAKGGFLPRKSIAQAGIPTVLRFNTNGTFDCSSTVRIPSMAVSKNLLSSGATDIELGNPILGTLQGTCGMGMYPFEIEFQS